MDTVFSLFANSSKGQGLMARPNILLVEDDPAVASVISSALIAENVNVSCCQSVAERDRQLKTGNFDLLITDVGLGDDDGLTSLKTVKAGKPDLPVIVISARNTLDTAVRASETGAFEYFPKPFDLDELVKVVAQALSRNHKVLPQSDFEDEQMPLIGRSPAMQDVYRMITRLLSNDLPVLILGESGTGKELVAEAIHNFGQRKSGPFIAINMAAIPAELIEAELFGHEKGAFTGAIADGIGKFEQANRGTLFLDEIGDMPMHAQTRLLRALQSGEISKVGGNKLIKLDVRTIAATNQNLPKLIDEGKFREDLYYRINVVPIQLPPLRQRKEDIPALANHFLNQASEQGLPRKHLTAEAMKFLKSNNWRGNVRELKNMINRLLVTAREDTIPLPVVMSELESELTTDGDPSPANAFEAHVKQIAWDIISSGKVQGNVYAEALKQFEVPLLMTALSHSNGNQIRAAKLLGINRNTLRKKLTDYGIDPSEIKLG